MSKNMQKCKLTNNYKLFLYNSHYIKLGIRNVKRCKIEINNN